MEQSNAASSNTSLEFVVEQFELWRKTRAKNAKIPNELWALVTPLLDQYKYNEIAAALRVKSSRLKDRILSKQSNPQQKKPKPFIECTLPISLLSTGGATIEFTCKNGSIVKISGLVVTQMEPLISLLLGD